MSSQILNAILYALVMLLPVDPHQYSFARLVDLNISQEACPCKSMIAKLASCRRSKAGWVESGGKSAYMSCLGVRRFQSNILRGGSETPPLLLHKSRKFDEEDETEELNGADAQVLNLRNGFAGPIDDLQGAPLSNNDNGVLKGPTESLRMLTRGAQDTRKLALNRARASEAMKEEMRASNAPGPPGVGVEGAEHRNFSSGAECRLGAGRLSARRVALLRDMQRVKAIQEIPKIVSEIEAGRLPDGVSVQYTPAVLFGKFVPMICEQLQDKRSSLVKETCGELFEYFISALYCSKQSIIGAITACVKLLGKACDSYSSALLSSLLQLTFVTVKVISSASWDCIHSIADQFNVSNVLSELEKGCQDLHLPLRHCCASVLVQTLRSRSNDELAANLESISQLVVKALNDPSVAVRNCGKQAISAVSEKFPENARKIVGQTSSNIRSHLLKTLKLEDVNKKQNPSPPDDFESFRRRFLQRDASSQDDESVVVKSPHESNQFDTDALHTSFLTSPPRRVPVEEPEDASEMERLMLTPTFKFLTTPIRKIREALEPKKKLEPNLPENCLNVSSVVCDKSLQNGATRPDQRRRISFDKNVYVLNSHGESNQESAIDASDSCYHKHSEDNRMTRPVTSSSSAVGESKSLDSGKHLQQAHLPRHVDELRLMGQTNEEEGDEEMLDVESSEGLGPALRIESRRGAEQDSGDQKSLKQKSFEPLSNMALGGNFVSSWDDAIPEQNQYSSLNHSEVPLRNVQKRLLNTKLPCDAFQLKVDRNSTVDHVAFESLIQACDQFLHDQKFDSSASLSNETANLCKPCKDCSILQQKLRQQVVINGFLAAALLTCKVTCVSLPFEGEKIVEKGRDTKSLVEMPDKGDADTPAGMSEKGDDKSGAHLDERAGIQEDMPDDKQVSDMSCNYEKDRFRRIQQNKKALEELGLTVKAQVKKTTRDESSADRETSSTWESEDEWKMTTDNLQLESDELTPSSSVPTPRKSPTGPSSASHTTTKVSQYDGADGDDDGGKLRSLSCHPRKVDPRQPGLSKLEQFRAEMVRAVYESEGTSAAEELMGSSLPSVVTEAFADAGWKSIGHAQANSALSRSEMQGSSLSREESSESNVSVDLLNGKRKQASRPSRHVTAESEGKVFSKRRLQKKKSKEKRAKPVKVEKPPENRTRGDWCRREGVGGKYYKVQNKYLCNNCGASGHVKRTCTAQHRVSASCPALRTELTAGSRRSTRGKGVAGDRDREERRSVRGEVLHAS
eukprot:542789-Hanusia_phi.AAC.3